MTNAWIALRRREGAAKRGGGQLRGESAFEPADGESGRHAGPDPTPAFVAEMTDNLRQRLGQLTDDVQRQLALGKLAGHTNQELASQLGISLRAVERKLGLIRRTWETAVEQ